MEIFPLQNGKIFISERKDLASPQYLTQTHSKNGILSQNNFQSTCKKASKRRKSLKWSQFYLSVVFCNYKIKVLHRVSTDRVIISETAIVKLYIIYGTKFRSTVLYRGIVEYCLRNILTPCPDDWWRWRLTGWPIELSRNRSDTFFIPSRSHDNDGPTTCTVFTSFLAGEPWWLWWLMRNADRHSTLEWFSECKISDAYIVYVS